MKGRVMVLIWRCAMKTHTTRFYSIGQKVCFKKEIVPPHGLPNSGTVYIIDSVQPWTHYVEGGAVFTQAVFFKVKEGIPVSGELLIPEEEYHQ